MAYCNNADCKRKRAEDEEEFVMTQGALIRVQGLLDEANHEVLANHARQLEDASADIGHRAIHIHDKLRLNCFQNKCDSY